MRDIFLSFFALLFMLSAQAQSYNYAVDSVSVSVKSVIDTNYIYTNYFDGNHAQRIAPPLSKDYDMNVILAKLSDLSLFYGNMTDIDTTSQNTFLKLNDSVYEIHVYNLIKPVFLVERNPLHELRYFIYDGNDETGMHGLTSGDVTSSRFDSVAYAETNGNFTHYASVHVNLLESGLTYNLVDKTSGRTIRKFIFYYHFPKPELARISTDTADINRLKSEPSSGFWTELNGQKNPTDSVFSQSKNSLLFVFKYFLFNKRNGYDYLIYKTDNQTKWSSTALSKSPAILLENLSTGKHTLYVKYPAKYAEVFIYKFTIAPN